MAKKLSKRLNVHPYPNKVTFTDNEDEFNRLTLRDCNLVHESKRYEGCCCWSECKGGIVVCVLNGSQSTLCHELNHAAIRIFYHVGMPVNEDTEEAFCYLVESMHKQCAAFMLRND